MPLSSTTDVLEPSEAVATATEPSEALAAATEPSEATHTPAKPSEGPHAPGELSEAPDALPLAGFASLEAALAPAVSASLARHPDARPCFIGMHLLALLEGTPLPDAPPMAPRPRDDLRREVRLLEGTLTDALNRVQASGGTRASLFRRLAADLIDRLDDNRRHRANPYSDSQAIWERVAKGDVVLVRASWLLQRAGFVQCGDGKHNYLWVPHSPPQPLPRRQELESQYPEAIMPLDELQAQHRNFRYTSQEATSTAAGVAHTSNAWADGANSLPVLTVSHVWETASHPDPEGRTLRIIAAELADGGWDAFDERGMPAGAPSCGLPLYRVWGMEDVGVFWDVWLGASRSHRPICRHRPRLMAGRRCPAASLPRLATSPGYQPRLSALAWPPPLAVGIALALSCMRSSHRSLRSGRHSIKPRARWRRKDASAAPSRTWASTLLIRSSPRTSSMVKTWHISALHATSVAGRATRRRCHDCSRTHRRAAHMSCPRGPLLRAMSPQPPPRHMRPTPSPPTTTPRSPHRSSAHCGERWSTFSAPTAARFAAVSR